MLTDHFSQSGSNPPPRLDPLYTHGRTHIQTDGDYIKRVVTPSRLKMHALFRILLFLSGHTRISRIIVLALITLRCAKTTVVQESTARQKLISTRALANTPFPAQMWRATRIPFWKISQEKKRFRIFFSFPRDCFASCWPHFHNPRSCGLHSPRKQCLFPLLLLDPSRHSHNQSVFLVSVSHCLAPLHADRITKK